MIFFIKAFFIFIMAISLPDAETEQIESNRDVTCTASVACFEVGCLAAGQTQCATVDCGSDCTRTCYVYADPPDGVTIDDPIWIASRPHTSVDNLLIQDKLLIHSNNL